MCPRLPLGLAFLMASLSGIRCRWRRSKNVAANRKTDGNTAFQEICGLERAY
jgi:hypothetical protein